MQTLVYFFFWKVHLMNSQTTKAIKPCRVATQVLKTTQCSVLPVEETALNYFTLFTLHCHASIKNKTEIFGVWCEPEKISGLVNLEMRGWKLKAPVFMKLRAAGGNSIDAPIRS